MMRDLTERKIGGDLAEDQPMPKKPTLVKPLPLWAQVDKVPLGPGSSFQPWQKPSGNNIDHTLGTTSNSNLAENDNKKNIENSSINSDQPAEDHHTPTNGSRVITSGGAVNDENTATESEIDKKLRRIISNRHAARRSRMKKHAYVEHLESKEHFFRAKLSVLRSQIEEIKKQQQMLQIEQHELKLQMATREKQRVFQEAAIEENKDEVQRLREVRSKLVAEAQARMLSVRASTQMMSNSNLNPSALDGVETSIKQADHSPITIKSEPADGDSKME